MPNRTRWHLRVARAVGFWGRGSVHTSQPCNLRVPRQVLPSLTRNQKSRLTRRCAPRPLAVGRQWHPVIGGGMRRRKPLVALAALAVVAAAGVVVVWPRAERVTRGNFDRIRDGMSRGEVAAILGAPGDYHRPPAHLSIFT